eukprot:NODE_1649_length_563_cov_514.225681_g1178_i1.p1 GENE.NODE_1649_length_563_cov_514.225681_g1178_i1~~NODE_1649_length_563_cov_514.225681_g1178_i1.p1  ORF type:complete len:130 (-),score=15.15 NODE_1649_length_563_cov_514.225681_g1178_i1:141-530(-)
MGTSLEQSISNYTVSVRTPQNGVKGSTPSCAHRGDGWCDVNARKIDKKETVFTWVYSTYAPKDWCLVEKGKGRSGWYIAGAIVALLAALIHICCKQQGDVEMWAVMCFCTLLIVGVVVIITMSVSTAAC